MSSTLSPAWDPVKGRAANDTEAQLIAGFKDEFARLRERILVLPANRERALALTHLEDSCMRTTRAVLEGQPPARP